jgi:RNA-directed DNA polymerase
MILCRRGKAEEALQRLREITGKLKLTVNEEKTRICKVPEEEFDFLGYSVLQRHLERRATQERTRCREAA